MLEESDHPQVKKHTPRRTAGEGGSFPFEFRGRTRWRVITKHPVEVITSDGPMMVKKNVTGTGDTPGEAAQRHRANLAKFAALSAAQQAQNRRNPKTLSSYYYDEWLNSARALRWRPHVLVGVRQRLEQHVLPVIGGSPVVSLTRDDFRDLFTQLTAKGFQESTLVNIWRNLYTLMGDAVYDDLRPDNPMDKIRPADRPQKKAPQTFFIPPKLVTTVQYEVAGTDQEPLRMLSLMLGLRIAELLGLTWDVVHLDPPLTMIEIRQQLKPIPVLHGDGCRRSPDTGKFACGKNGANCPHHVVTPKMRGLALYPYVKTNPRNVALVPQLVELLKKQKRRQDRWRKSPEWEPVNRQGMNNLVFTTPTGKPLRQQQVGAEWKQLLLDCGFTELTQHKARHIAITALILNNTPLSVIGSIVGHADSRVTERVYAQINENDQREHMERLSMTYDAERAAFEREEAERAWRTTRASVERVWELRSEGSEDVILAAREVAVIQAMSKLESQGRNEHAVGLEQAWREGWDREACWKAAQDYAKAHNIKLDVNDEEVLRFSRNMEAETRAIDSEA